MLFKKQLMVIFAVVAAANAGFTASPINSVTVKPLRACTTGDYPPLTFYNAQTKAYQGFAITVIEQFAHSVKRPVSFVKTTWSNLNHDLKTKCDFAVGGITRTPQREALFSLSDNLLPNRKVPVFSKENNASFGNFKAIDRKGVTVLENKGGTNEPFAQSHIKNAGIKILPQNEQVYACLNEYPKRHYVMFTDAIEVQYRTHKSDSLLSNKGLKIHIPDNPSSYKVFMSNKTAIGQKLMQTFNAFYKQHKTDAAKWYQEALNIDYPHLSVECPVTNLTKGAL